MHRYTVGNAFSEAMAFFKNNMNNLLFVLGTAIVIGQVAQALMVGGGTEAIGQQFAEQMQSGNVDAVVTMFGGLFAAMMIAAIVQSAAQFAILRQDLSDEKDIGTTMVYGLVATIVNLLFWMAVGAVIGLLFVGLIAMTGIGASLAQSGGPSANGIAGVVGLVFFLLLVVFPLGIWLASRLWVASAAMAHVRSVNPLFGLAQSWRLTSGSVQWSVLGTLLLFILVIFAASMVLGIVGALFTFIGGQMVGSIIAGVIAGVPTGIASLAMTGGVYRALIPTDTRYEVFN